MAFESNQPRRYPSISTVVIWVLVLAAIGVATYYLREPIAQKIAVLRSTGDQATTSAPALPKILIASPAPETSPSTQPTPMTVVLGNPTPVITPHSPVRTATPAATIPVSGKLPKSGPDDMFVGVLSTFVVFAGTGFIRLRAARAALSRRLRRLDIL